MSDLESGAAQCAIWVFVTSMVSTPFLVIEGEQQWAKRTVAFTFVSCSMLAIISYFSFLSKTSGRTPE